MDMSRYRELYLSETREHINRLNQLIVTLEQSPGDRPTVDALFREVHSIKGMASTMGFDCTTRLSHHLEDLLDGLRGGDAVPATTIDYLLAGIDLLDGLLDDVQSERSERSVEAFISDFPGENKAPGGASPVQAAQVAEPGDAEAAPASAAGGGPKEMPTSSEESAAFSVLVDLEENTPASAARCLLILQALEKSGSVLSSKPDLPTLRSGAPCLQMQVWLSTSLTKDHVEEALQRISGVSKVSFVDDRRKQDERNRNAGGRTIRVRTDLLDQFVNLTGELITNRYMLSTAQNGRDWGELSKALNQAGRLIDNLHHHVLQARLMPLENITGRLPRIVRDLSRKADKKVTFRLNGAGVGIDRVVLEELTDPLVHLVRNAVDHGINREGTVTVSARRERDLVLIEVADDGVGMDPDRLREKAVESGLMSRAQAEALSRRDALMLVCQPGFSTAREVTETSGRGVGMDVVKEAVRALGGTLEIISAPGCGTRFQMWLPHSIAIIKILLVDCGGQVLAIPITRVLRTLDLPTGEIQPSGQNQVFRLGEEQITLVSLAGILGLPESPIEEPAWVVLTEVQGRHVGLRVDRFVGHREAFVKSIGFPLNLLTGLSGATVEGDGKVVFIVDPQSLLEGISLAPAYDPGEADAIQRT